MVSSAGPSPSPAWALLLAAGGAVAGWDAIPRLAQLLNLLLVPAAGGLAAALTLRLTDRWLVAGLAGAAVMAGPHLLFAGVAGMESPLFVVLLLAVLVLRVEGRWTAAAWVAGSMVWVRPEGALVAAALGVDALLGERRAFPRMLPGLLLPGAVLGAGLQLYYGSPLPHSVAAKQAGLYPFSVSDSTSDLLGQLGAAFALPAALDLPAVGVLPWLALGAAWLAVKRRELLVVPLLLAAFVAFYATSRTLIFPHYIAHFESLALAAWGGFFYAAGSAVGRVVAGVVGGSGAAARPLPRAARTAAFAVAALAVLLPSVRFYPAASVAAGQVSLDDAVYGYPHLRMRFYRIAAETVRGALPEGTTILMPEIGELGFRFPDARVLDAAGLVSPEALPHLPLPEDEQVYPGGGIPSSLVREEEPDLVVTLERFGARSIYRDPWFEERYATVWQWPDPRLTWGTLRIHAREDFAAGQRLRELEGGVANTPAPGSIPDPTGM